MEDDRITLKEKPVLNVKAHMRTICAVSIKRQSTVKRHVNLSLCVLMSLQGALNVIHRKVSEAPAHQYLSFKDCGAVQSVSH